MPGHFRMIILYFIRYPVDCFTDDDEVEFHSANRLHILAKTLEVIPPIKAWISLAESMIS
jgi:hypothetical protein